MKFSLAAIVLMGVSASAVDLTADVSISFPFVRCIVSRGLQSRVIKKEMICRNNSTINYK
jgi:hypothetical protein